MSVNNPLRYITLDSLRVTIVHLTYLKGLEIPELNEEDYMAVIYLIKNNSKNHSL